MKIILTASSDNLDGPVDMRFGRAPFFFLYDIDAGAHQTIINPGTNASGGAGIKAAQYVDSLGVKAVISGEFGPNAFDALNAAGIAMYRYESATTCREAIDSFIAGKLAMVGGPSEKGRHSRG